MGEFELAAGFEAAQISLFFSVITVSGFFIWAAWCTWKQYQLFAKDRIDGWQFMTGLMKLYFFLIVLLIYIQT